MPIVKLGSFEELNKSAEAYDPNHCIAAGNSALYSRIMHYIHMTRTSIDSNLQFIRTRISCNIYIEIILDCNLHNR